MTPPHRLSGLDPARARFGERADRIVPFFSEGDTLADDAVIALSAWPEARARSVLAHALEHGIDSLHAESRPEALVRLFRQLEHVPWWVNRERCRRGGRAFFRCGPFGGIALGFGSLARAYCSSGGNKPLAMMRTLIDRAPAPGAAKRAQRSGVRYWSAVTAAAERSLREPRATVTD